MKLRQIQHAYIPIIWGMGWEGDENLRALGIYFVASKAALAPLEINYLNSCDGKDRIGGGKQPLSHGQGAGTPGYNTYNGGNA